MYRLLQFLHALSKSIQLQLFLFMCCSSEMNSDCPWHTKASITVMIVGVYLSSTNSSSSKFSSKSLSDSELILEFYVVYITTIRINKWSKIRVVYCIKHAEQCKETNLYFCFRNVGFKTQYFINS